MNKELRETLLITRRLELSILEKTLELGIGRLQKEYSRENYNNLCDVCLEYGRKGGHKYWVYARRLIQIHCKTN